MSERPLAGFSEWPADELEAKAATYPIGHRIGDEMRAEIARRDKKQAEVDSKADRGQARITFVLAWVGTIAAVIAAIASVWALLK